MRRTVSCDRGDDRIVVAESVDDRGPTMADQEARGDAGRHLGSGDVHVGLAGEDDGPPLGDPVRRAPEQVRGIERVACSSQHQSRRPHSGQPGFCVEGVLGGDRGQHVRRVVDGEDAARGPAESTGDVRQRTRCLLAEEEC